MAAVLDRYCPDYRGLLINLFEPAAANALELVILGRPDKPLRINGTGLERLYDLFGSMSRAEIRRCLLGGADRLKADHEALDQCACANFSRYCGQLAVRIDLLRDHGGLSGIFMTA